MDINSWDESRRLDALLREATILAGIHPAVPLARAILEEEIARTRAAIEDSSLRSSHSGNDASLQPAASPLRSARQGSHLSDPRNFHPLLTSRNNSSSCTSSPPEDGATSTHPPSSNAAVPPTFNHPSHVPSASSTNSSVAAGIGPRKRIKLKVPAEKYPEYNFVGRLLGPRGATLKKLERETGCKIMIRGRGSIRKDKEADVRGKPGWEHVFQDNLHVVIEVSDARDEQYALRALNCAKEAVELLLVPVPEEKDSLKRQQLRDLAILNGTFRASDSAQGLSSSAIGSTANSGNGNGVGLRQHNAGGNASSGVSGNSGNNVGGGGGGGGGTQAFTASHVASSPPRAPPMSPVLRLNGYGSGSGSGSGSAVATPGTNVGSVHSRNAGAGGISRNLPRIPTLDIESVNESFLVSPSTIGGAIPARSPTIVDPEMYPFPPTPGIVSSDANASKASFGSPIWSPIHSAPVPAPMPSPILPNQNLLAPGLGPFATSPLQTQQHQQHPSQKLPPGRASSSSPAMSSLSQADFHHQLHQQTYQHEQQLQNQLHHPNAFHQGAYSAFGLHGGNPAIGDTIDASSDVGTTMPLHFSQPKPQSVKSSEMHGVNASAPSESRFLFSHSHFRDASQTELDPHHELEMQFQRTRLHDEDSIPPSHYNASAEVRDRDALPDYGGIPSGSRNGRVAGNDGDQNRETPFTNFFPNVTAGLGDTSSPSS